MNEIERNALKEIAAGLRSGRWPKMEAEPFSFAPVDYHARLPAVGFNMQLFTGYNPCGTVCCIGGLLQDVYGLRPDLAENGVNKLFYPTTGEVIDYDAITPLQAAQAIDNFLSTGDPDWSSIL